VAQMTTSDVLDDALVDSLEPEWDTDRGRFLLRSYDPTESTPGIRVLANLVTLINPDDLDLLATGLVAGATRGTDAGGYTVEGDAAVAWDAGDNQITLSRAALTRLMVRLLDVAVQHVANVARLAELAESLRQPG
jgi:hypothetical protein